MFDSLKFGVGIVTEENFSSYTKGDLTWCYAWKYPEKPKNDAQEKEWADDLGATSLPPSIPAPCPSDSVSRTATPLPGHTE